MVKLYLTAKVFKFRMLEESDGWGSECSWVYFA
jgi:hypothetical protein